MNPPSSLPEFEQLVIKTEFVVEGQQRVEAALRRIETINKLHLDNAKRRAREAARATDMITIAFNQLNRQTALEKIERGFVAASKTGKDFDRVLDTLDRKLKLVGATQEETNRIIRAGAEAVRAQQQATAGTARGAALQAFGREARLSLPAFGIPGTGLSTEFLFRAAEVAGRLNLNFKDLAISGGLTVAAIGAVSIAFNQFQSTVQPVIDLLNSVRRARFEAAGFLATASPEEVVNERARLLNEVTSLEAQRNQAIQDRLQTILNTEDSPLGNFLLGIEAIGKGPIADANTDIAELDSQLAAARISLEALNGVYEENNRLVEQARILRQQEANLDLQRQTRLQVETLSADAIRERIDLLERESELIEGDLNTYAISIEKQEEYRTRLDQIGLQMDVLKNALPRAEEIERLAEAEEYLKKQREEQAALTEKFNRDLENLEQQTAERRAELAQRLNDRLVDLARKAADDAEDAVRKLEQRRSDLGDRLRVDFSEAEIDLQQDRLDAQLKFQRDEAKAARSHAEKMVDIRRQGQLAEQDAIAGRDAVALFRARQQTTERLRTEQDRFSAERRERQIALRDNLRDLQVQFRREREERLRKYERDIADAQQQYERELQQRNLQRQRAERDLMITHARETQMLNEKSARQLKLINDAYIAELRIVSQGQQARLQMEAAYQRQLVLQAQRALQFGTTHAPTIRGTGGSGFFAGQFAAGGDLRAGLTGLVNEIRRESFTSGGRTIALPEGMGLFTPLKSGRVNPNGGGTTLNINLNGATVRTIEATSRRVVHTELDAALDELGV